MTMKIAKTTTTVDDTTIGAEAAERAATGRTKAKPGKTPPVPRKPRQRPALAHAEAKPERTPRTDTKQARLIAMLKAKDGATVEDIAAAFGWQAHTVRGALYGALRKKLGIDVTSEKVEGKGRVYRIGS